MATWEYLRLGREPQTVMVAPAGTIALNWLVERYSDVKLERYEDDCESLHFDEYYDAPRAYHDLIKHVCSQGWEPFAVSDETIHFRREGKGSEELR